MWNTWERWFSPGTTQIQLLWRNVALNMMVGLSEGHDIFSFYLTRFTSAPPYIAVTPRPDAIFSTQTMAGYRAFKVRVYETGTATQKRWSWDMMRPTVNINIEYSTYIHWIWVAPLFHGSWPARCNIGESFVVDETFELCSNVGLGCETTYY